MHGNNSVCISRRNVWVSFCKLRAETRCLKTSWHSSNIVEKSHVLYISWWHHIDKTCCFLTKEKPHSVHNLTSHLWRPRLRLICSSFPEEHIHAISICMLNLVTTKMQGNKRLLHPRGIIYLKENHWSLGKHRPRKIEPKPCFSGIWPV